MFTGIEIYHTIKIVGVLIGLLAIIVMAGVSLIKEH